MQDGIYGGDEDRDGVIMWCLYVFAGGSEKWAGTSAGQAVISASALWSTLVRPQSPFGLPTSQDGLPGPGTASYAAMAAEGTGCALPNGSNGHVTSPVDSPMDEDRTVPDMRRSAAGSADVDAALHDGQLALPDGHKPHALLTAGAAAAVHKSGSFGIPETPSLGGELRGGFSLPQRLNSLQMQVGHRSLT